MVTRGKETWLSLAIAKTLDGIDEIINRVLLMLACFPSA